MDNFSVDSTPTGVTAITCSGSSIAIKYIIGFPAALLRGMISVVNLTGSVILPTKNGTYVVRPVPGEEAVVGRKHTNEP